MSCLATWLLCGSLLLTVLHFGMTQAQSTKKAAAVSQADQLRDILSILAGALTRQDTAVAPPATTVTTQPTTTKKVWWTPPKPTAASHAPAIASTNAQTNDVLAQLLAAIQNMPPPTPVSSSAHAHVHGRGVQANSHAHAHVSGRHSPTRTAPGVAAAPPGYHSHMLLERLDCDTTPTSMCPARCRMARAHMQTGWACCWTECPYNDHDRILVW